MSEAPDLRAERRWSWRTWNLLLQIQRATDGEDPRQRAGEMTERGLLVARTPAMRALDKRGWAEAYDVGELPDDPRTTLPQWRATPAGRAALRAARAAGITVQ